MLARSSLLFSIPSFRRKGIFQQFFFEMKGFKFFVPLFLTFLLTLSRGVFGGDDDEGKQACILKEKQMIKTVMKSFGACKRELGMAKKSSQEYHDKLGCLIKCVMRKFEVLDKDDLITADKVMEHVENILPPSHHKHAHEALMKCVELHDILDNKDPLCKAYQNLGFCMQDALVKLCGGGMQMATGK